MTGPDTPEHSAPIDHAYLAKYTLGNSELESEVLGLFASQAPLYLAQMRGALTEKEWKDAAHTLKGSARAVGAHVVARCAETAERVASHRDGEDKEAALMATEEALSRACAYIEALGDDRSAVDGALVR